jgi:hypothetical protein
VTVVFPVALAMVETRVVAGLVDMLVETRVALVLDLDIEGLVALGAISADRFSD